MKELPKITPQQAKVSYRRILDICSSQGSWRDKSNALRTVFDNLLDELCKNNGIPEGSSRFQERRESLYPEGSEERELLGKLSGNLNKVQHKIHYNVTRKDFYECLRTICDHIAKSSGSPYPDELALLLKPVARNNDSVKRPVIILKELYSTLDQVKHADLFLQSYNESIRRKNSEGFKNIQFDLITYTVNPILSLGHKDKYNFGEPNGSHYEESRKEITKTALKKVLETIKDRYWGDMSGNSKTPFFFWIFYNLPLKETDEIVEDINSLVSELDISFYPIVVSQGKESTEIGKKAKDLFPKSKHVVIQNHPELPDNLFKTIFNAISATNQKPTKSYRK